MKKQRGQTLVEFALMAPMIFLLVFAMIYGGVMFMDYLNFCNEARTLARRIAVASTADRAELMKTYNTDKGEEFARFYTVNMTAKYSPNDEKPVDAVVTVTFNRNNEDLPWVVYKIGFPPQTFKIVYSMKLEKERS